MTLRSELGRLGEEAAARYLSQKGYRVVERNFRRPWGELDVVARAPDGTLVLVEVKTMRPGALRPEDQMSRAKLEKFRRVASLYAGAHRELVDDRRGWRLDLVALVREGSRFRVRHYENI